MIGTAALFAVGLFGYMASHSSRKPPEQTIDASAKFGERPPATTGAVDEAEATAPSAAPPSNPGVPPARIPRDRAAFCAGGVVIHDFEAKMMDAVSSVEGLQALLRTDRASWEAAVEQLRVGAPPISQDDVELYGSGYGKLFDAVLATPPGGRPELAPGTPSGNQLRDAFGHFNYELRAACE
jgi:hypothetical protein